MPVFDPIALRVCLRVVYDGVGGAGKTTNLRVLSELFASQRRLELASPGELGRKTMTFDWLEIRAGAVCGLPLTCQILSVPGQAALTPRRRVLLESADVVVFVCESSPEGVEAGRGGLEALDDLVEKRSLPIVIQANKQDRPSALSGAAVVGALGRDAPVVEAVAAERIGVMDTLLSAVRIVARAMSAEESAGALRLPVRRAESSGEALRRVLDQRIDPEWASELYLEEVAAAMLVERELSAGTPPTTSGSARAAKGSRGGVGP